MIKIKYAVPLSEHILLVIVTSPENGRSDAVILVASFDAILLPEYIESLKQTL